MKKNLGKIIAGVAIVLGLIAVLMIFAKAIVPNSDYAKLLGDKAKDANIAGSAIAFGKKEEVLGKTVTTYMASAYILAFLLPLIGVALAVVALLGKGGKIVPIVAAVCFLVGGIIYFLPLQTITPNKDALIGVEVADWREGLQKNFTLGAGAIVGGLFSILAACASCATLFVKKAK